MKKILKRIISLLLLVALLLLTSCTQQKSENVPAIEDSSYLETTEESIEEISTQNYDDILSKRLDKNFNGRSFRIATDNKDLILADNGESLLGKEHYLRNLAIEKKYNVKITLTDESGTPELVDRIKTDALAGIDYCDLIILQSSSFQTLTVTKALENVRSIPYFDINASFFYEKSLSSTTLGETSYGIAGEFIFSPEDTNVVFFNKTLLAQAPLPDLYSLVNDNQWDMENFLLYAEEVYSLALENGAKVHGILSTKTSEELVKIFWAATGMDLIRNNYGERPELVYNNADTVSFIEKFRNTFIYSASFSSANTQQSAVSSFSNGEGLFLIAPLSTAPQLVGSGIDWGIVPIPKLDINQKSYFSYVEDSYSLAGFAKGTKDLSFSGIVASAFFACSENLNQKYTIQTYLNLYFTSPNDAKIMEYATDSPYYEAAEFLSLFDSSFTSATQTVLYRSASAGTELEELYEQGLKMFNKYLDTIF